MNILNEKHKNKKICGLIKNPTFSTSLDRQVISKASYFQHKMGDLFKCFTFVWQISSPCIFLYHFCIDRELVSCSRTNDSLCHPAAAPGLYKAKGHHAHLNNYATPPPSADAIIWHVPSKPLVP